MNQRRGELQIPDVVPRAPTSVPVLAWAEPAVPAALTPPVLRARCPRAEQRRRLRLELATLAVALALPVVLWHATFRAVVSAFDWQASYFFGLAPMTLMVLGVLCYLPVIAHRARRPEAARFYRAAPLAWQAWAICLYLLGFVLAAQVAQLARGVGAS